MKYIITIMLMLQVVVVTDGNTPVICQTLGDLVHCF